MVHQPSLGLYPWPMPEGATARCSSWSSAMVFPEFDVYTMDISKNKSYIWSTMFCQKRFLLHVCWKTHQIICFTGQLQFPKPSCPVLTSDAPTSRRSNKELDPNSRKECCPDGFAGFSVSHLWAMPTLGNTTAQHHTLISNCLSSLDSSSCPHFFRNAGDGDGDIEQKTPSLTPLQPCASCAAAAAGPGAGSSQRAQCNCCDNLLGFSLKEFQITKYWGNAGQSGDS